MKRVSNRRRAFVRETLFRKGIHVGDGGDVPTYLRPYQFHQTPDELRGCIHTKVETFFIDHFTNVEPESRAKFLGDIQ